MTYSPSSHGKSVNKNKLTKCYNNIRQKYIKSDSINKNIKIIITNLWKMIYKRKNRWKSFKWTIEKELNN